MLCFEFKEYKENQKELKYSDCFLLLAKDQDQDLFEQCKKVVKMQLSKNEIKIYKTIYNFYKLKEADKSIKLSKSLLDNILNNINLESA